MSIFLLPDTFLDELHRMLNVYWWKHDSNHAKGLVWSSWEDLCNAKNDGGLSFKNLHIFNLALLGKMGWRLMNDLDALVCLVFKVKYCHHRDFCSSSAGRNPSYMWRSIWTTKDFIRKGTRWKIGLGDSVTVWNQPWLDSDDYFYIQTLPIQGFEDMVVLDLLISGIYFWDVPVIQEVFWLMMRKEFSIRLFLLLESLISSRGILIVQVAIRFDWLTS